jgi:polysaccharide pyruvyl transferase WcaK-like protein
VLGGGGILRDNTSLSNLVQILDEIWLKKLMAGKTALYAVGAGPFQTTVGKWLVRRTLAMCDLLTVRDEGSKAELAGIGVPPERIRVVADPALLLAPSPIQDPALRRWLISAAQTPRTLGLFLEEDYTPVREMARALDTLHSEHGFRFIGVPMRHHGAADDRQMARRVRDAMRYPDAVDTVDAPLTAAELKWTAAQFALNITVRLHALIFSVSMGTPAIAVNYDAKVAYFLNSFGLDDWRVDVTKEAGNDIVVKTLEAYSDLHGSRQRISRRLEEQRQRASMAFVLLRQVLEGAGIPRTAAQSEFAG